MSDYVPSLHNVNSTLFVFLPILINTILQDIEILSYYLRYVAIGNDLNFKSIDFAGRPRVLKNLSWINQNIEELCLIINV